jgi:hypothetical protein
MSSSPLEKEIKSKALSAINLLFKDVITLFISKFINFHERWDYLKDKYESTIGFKKLMLLKYL